MMKLTFTLLLFSLFSLPAVELSFNEQVLPILSDKCFHCHGPDEKHRKAKLRLDSFKEAVKKNKKGKTAITPGKPENSLLIHLIETTDEDDIMPPEDTGKTLTKEEKAILRQWVVEGAEYEKHWAFTQPLKAKLPKIKNTEWPVSPIDFYVLNKLEKKGLTPSPEAESYTLIRRLHLDLTGLPPTPQEVKDFVKNPSNEAYEITIDRLLESDAYAERMAMVWMDAARYSDSDGFQQDATRENWPWKEWVIQAYKNNMPFDQFTTEQLAGDLLPDATPQQILATAFNRHHMTNGEGGRDPEESRIDYVMDRVNTVGTVWLGLTFGCAQCHTHKFDPVSHKNYYQLNAFFNSIDEDGKAGNNAKPYLNYAPELNKEGFQDANDWLVAMKEKENHAVTNAIKGFEEWLSDKAHRAAKEEHFSSWEKVIASKLKANDGADIEQLDAGEFSVSGVNSRHEDYAVTTTPQISRITGLRLKVKPMEDQHKYSMDEDGHVILTNLKVFIRDKKSGIQKSVEFGGAKASYEKTGKGWKKYGPAKGILDDDPRTGWTTTGSDFKDEHTIVVSFAQDYKLSSDNEVLIELRHRSLAGHKNIRRFSLELTGEYGSTAKQIGKTAGERLAELKGDISKLNDSEMSELRNEFLSSKPAVREARSNTATARNSIGYYKKSAGKQQVMVMKERATPRDTHILVRGVWNNKGEKVTPGVPEEIAPWPENSPKNRLGLATWLINKQNPLTARVAVNRYWQMIFGTGLVRTPEDFGLQGERPTHPKVIDWLAAEFMENNWNVKHIIKTIVMSQTYRQSSDTTAALRKLDPENRLLARAPRFRMPSWMIRDTILHSSGLLTQRVGGPPVFPYQPAGAWADSTMGRFEYKVSPGKDAYRRSLYTFWRRSVGPTNMYDSSKRRNCSTRLIRTNTPLHALNLLNDTSYIEAAAHLAKQSIQSRESTEERLNFIALKVISRPLNQNEMAILTNQYKESFDYFNISQKEAEDLLNHGQSDPGPGNFNAPETAAYLTVAQTVLNLDESLNRE